MKALQIAFPGSGVFTDDDDPAAKALIRHFEPGLMTQPKNRMS